MRTFKENNQRRNLRDKGPRVQIQNMYNGGNKTTPCRGSSKDSFLKTLELIDFYKNKTVTGIQRTRILRFTFDKRKY